MVTFQEHQSQGAFSNYIGQLFLSLNHGFPAENKPFPDCRKISKRTAEKFLKVYVHKVTCQLFNFHDGGRYHIETSPLICGANQWTGFYKITVKRLRGCLYRGELARLSGLADPGGISPLRNSYKNIMCSYEK